MPEELDSYQDKGNKPNWWDMSLEFGIACMSSKLKSWEMSAFPLGTVRWEYNSFCFITMNIIFSFFVSISLTFFLYCCISEFFSYDYRYLSNQVANGSVEQFIDTARFVVLTVTRLFVQPFSFKPKFLLIQCCSAYIPACPEGSFFPSLLFVSATGLALSLESLTVEREILSLIFPGVPSNPSFDVFPFRVAWSSLKCP